MQTETVVGRGNCVAACVASILELDIAEVPNFRLSPDPWRAMQEWLWGRGLFAVQVSADSDRIRPLPQVWCILVGKSPRGNVGHAVVGVACDRGWVMVHDPHPDGTGLIGDPEWITFLAVTQPQHLLLVPVDANAT